MKIGIIGDVHWSQYSSIVRKRGKKYSLRLENCIDSVTWAEKLTQRLGCEFNIYLGDFFDKPDLNSEEISALKDIKWNDLDKYFLVGNHEMGSNNLEINSSNVFQLSNNFYDAIEGCRPFFVIDKFAVIPLDINREVGLFLLPYILEEHRDSIASYTSKHDFMKKILLMHNDIAGIQLGGFISKQGFEIEDIQNNSSLCINGHIHNGSIVADKVINIGNLTGQNFSENAHVYDHVIFILDTNTLKIDVYENPYAFNFYKEDWTEGIPFTDDFKNNAVLTVQTSEETYDDAKIFIENSEHIVESRILLKPVLKDISQEEIKDLSIDQYQALSDYVLSNIDASELAQEELKYILE